MSAPEIILERGPKTVKTGKILRNLLFCAHPEHILLVDLLAGVHFDGDHILVRLVIQAVHHSGKNIDALPGADFPNAIFQFHREHSLYYRIVLVALRMNMTGQRLSRIHGQLTNAIPRLLYDNLPGSPAPINHRALVKIFPILFLGGGRSDNALDILGIFPVCDIHRVPGSDHNHVLEAVGHNQLPLRCVEHRGILAGGEDHVIFPPFPFHLLIGIKIADIHPAAAQRNHRQMVALLQEGFLDVKAGETAGPGSLDLEQFSFRLIDCPRLIP